jgi:SAM-dependent methyltransferase
MYEVDDFGNVLLDANGNPIRLPEPVDITPHFKKLAASVPVAVGRARSRKERLAKNLSSADLTYSEVTLELMQSVFATLKKLRLVVRKKGRFLDLGSGTGKAVLLAAMLHPFESCVGVEVLSGLHETSMELLERFNTVVAKTLPHPTPRVEFVLGDLAEVAWQDASVLFINMTTFTEPLVDAIKEAASGMPRGTVCITVTKHLHTSAWELLHVSELPLNWGTSNVYIQQKVL